MDLCVFVQLLSSSLLCTHLRTHVLSTLAFTHPMQAYADSPDVTTPLLKFMAEFVFNKSTRLTFESSSPNGILLFRCVEE